MTDVTAQAFREAAAERESNAAYLHRDGENILAARDRQLAALLLAAAEQREQLDILQGSVAGQSDFIRTMGREHQQQMAAQSQVASEEYGRIIDAMASDLKANEQQIATLSADLKANAAMLARQCDLAREAENHAATLTAERDQARTLLADVKLHLT